MASDPQSAPQPRLQPTLVHLTLAMVPSSQESMFHCWPGCMMCGRLGAPLFSTEQVCLVGFRLGAPFCTEQVCLVC